VNRDGTTVRDEPPRITLEHLRHAVADTIVPFDLRIDAERDPRAQIVRERLERRLRRDLRRRG
jgi:hypothetical protein